MIGGAGSRRDAAGVDSRNMHSDSSDLNLLMVHADDHAPVLAEGLPGDAAGTQDGAADDSGAEHFWDEGGDPNDLELQRWGVIAPQGPAGDRLLALIEPLIARRQQQQGDAVRIYRVPSQMTADEAMRWKKREFDSGADLNIEVPRYQLILGDLDQVPLALQQVQASDGYVGRLAFAAEDDYAAYVDKLLRWESLSEGPSESDALFFTVHDGTAATAVGHRALVAPGVEVVKKRKASGQYPARDIVEFGDRMTPSPDELLRRVAGGAPNVLFTLSHGEGAPRGGWKSPEEQRRRQGAMSFGREGKLMGDDLRARSFLPGGIWFMLACYGAGTPGHSAYKHWLEALASAGQFRGKPESVLAGLAGPDTRPFVAALPQAVLANPNGPLAFMGHVDLAWTYGFQDLDSGATNRPARYMAITRSLLKRDRVGVSMRELLRFFDQTNVELTSLHDQEARARSMGQPVQPDVARQSHLWMLRNDLAAYVLLGDPAVKLPPGGDPPTIRQAPREQHVITATAANPTATSPAPAATSTSAHAPATAPKPASAAPSTTTANSTAAVPGARPAPAPSAAPPAAATASNPTESDALAPAPSRPATSATPPATAATSSASDAPAPALEEALARWLLADLEIDAAAARAGIPRAELERLGALFRRHGRAGLHRT